MIGERLCDTPHTQLAFSSVGCMQQAHGGWTIQEAALTDFEVIRLLHEGEVLVLLDGKANVGLGAATSARAILQGSPGRLRFLSDGQNRRVELDAEANLFLGGDKADGDIVLFNGNAATAVDTSKASIHLNAGGAASMTLRSEAGARRVLVNAEANLYLGGDTADGDIVLFTGNNEPASNDVSKATIHLDGGGADLWLGGNGMSGDIMLFKGDVANNHDSSLASIRLNGSDGDIELRGADCAEEFDIAEGDPAGPGSVMVLDDQSMLRTSSEAYDCRVAGVLSGGGHFQPGLVLDRNPSAGRRAALAMVGKVFCKIDARRSPVAVGDLLTTSGTPGHAMKASNRERAFGAVIGKALTPLAGRCGMAPILVALQ